MNNNTLHDKETRKTYYRQDLKLYNPKRSFKGSVIMFFMATFVFAIGAVILFVFYRPFVPWVKIVCSEEDGTFEVVEDTDYKYIYEINGNTYEKILYNVGSPNHGGIVARRTIYVNQDNPEDVKPNGFGGWFVVTFSVMFMLLGGYFYFLSIRVYAKYKKRKVYASTLKGKLRKRS